jgi:methionyl-tRNA formyltransferase
MTVGAIVMADADVGEALANHLVTHYRADIAAIVTMSENKISRLARDAGVKTFVFQDNDQILAEIKDNGLQIEIGYLLWWPRIIGSRILNISDRGFINTHPSLLPYARGKHYNFWTIVEQAPFGVTIHAVTPDIDSGDIVAQAPIPYGWTDTGETLYLKAKRRMVELFIETYPQLRAGKFQRRAQDAGAGSFHRAAELDPASTIDLDRCYAARDLLNLLRARTFAGHPACRFHDAGRTYEVRVDIKEVPQ